MNKDEENIVYVQLDNWYDMGEATQYLDELENGEHDNEINYVDVWYDMAIIHCITTTKDYIKEHPELEEHIESLEHHNTFASYYPKYDPSNFGCNWYGEYQGWAPYKEFNKQIWNSLKEKSLVDENGNMKTNKD